MTKHTNTPATTKADKLLYFYLLHERDELGGVPRPLVVLDQLLHVVGVLEDVQPAHAGESELLGAHARVANLRNQATKVRRQNQV